MLGYNFKKRYCILLSEDLFYLYKRVDHDEMQHYAAFHLGLHRFQKRIYNFEKKLCAQYLNWSNMVNRDH